MIRLDQIKAQSYLIYCRKCRGTGILEPDVLDPRPVYTTCYKCNGTGSCPKKPTVSEEKFNKP